MSTKQILFLILLFTVFGASAQKTVSHQNLYWLRYHNQLVFNKKISWNNEIENRRFFENNTQHHTIMHSHLHYKFYPNADVAFGLTYSLQSPQDPNATIDLVVPEKRIFQEISYDNPISSRFKLTHRLRIDERFIHKNNGKILLDGNDFNFRFRYRLQASCSLNSAEAKVPTTLKISNELMLNAGSTIVYNQFDQNRVYAGIEQGFTKNLSAELGYIHWYQQRASGNQFFSREIIRLTVFHKINI